MKDETFAFISDVKDKKITARSARHTRTHCGRGGRVRLPSDNLSKKELQKMNGECKSYRLNDPMAWQEFKSMPDDLKITYIKLLREKFGVPDSYIGEMMGVSQRKISLYLTGLGISSGKGYVKKWDKDGFFAWWHGVDKPSEPTQEETVEQDSVQAEEPETYVEDDLPFEEPELMAVAVPDAGIAEQEAQIAELKAVHEKDKAEIAWLRNECDSLRNSLRLREAQLEIVQLIFGGRNHG